MSAVWPQRGLSDMQATIDLLPARLRNAIS